MDWDIHNNVLFFSLVDGKRRHHSMTTVDGVDGLGEHRWNEATGHQSIKFFNFAVNFSFQTR